MQRSDVVNTAKILTIDPLNMSALDRYVLAIFLHWHHEQKISSFRAGAAYPMPKLDVVSLHYSFPLENEIFKYRHIQLKYGLNMRKRCYSAYETRYPWGFCFDILSGKYFLNEKYGQLPEIIGTLMPAVDDVTFDPEIVYSITPSAMSEKTSAILSEILLDEYRNNLIDDVSRIFHAYIKHPIAGSNAHFCLTQALCRRRRGHAPRQRELAEYLEDYTYDVYGAVFADNGAYSTVNDILGSLIPRANGTFLYHQHKQRLGKDQGSKKPLAPETVTREFSITSLFPLLRMKHPVFFPGQYSSRLVVRHISGEDLQKFIDRDRKEKLAGRESLTIESQGNQGDSKGAAMKDINGMSIDGRGEQKNFNSTSTDKRLLMCINCLRAVNRIHAKGVIHRDIKAPNFIVDLNSEYVDVEIIDFGLSSLISEDNRDRVGTPLYFAPEHFYNDRITGKLPQPLTQKADVYTLAWVLAQILRADDNPAQDLPEVKHIANNCVFQGLFEGITDLTTGQDDQQEHAGKKVRTRGPADVIEETLYDMVKPDPERRCSAVWPLKIFEEVLLQRKLARIGAEDKKEEIRAVSYLALGLRSSLEALNADTLPDVKKKFSEVLQKIPDSEGALKEFVFCLDVRFLRGIRQKDNIRTKVDEVIDAFTKNCQALSLMHQKISLMLQSSPDNRNKRLLERIIAMLNVQMEAAPALMTLDEISLFAYRYGKYYHQFAIMIERYGIRLPDMVLAANMAPGH